MATKILIVEDNELNMDMLSRRLERKGFEIISAVDGQEGINKTETMLPHLILMDMSLPIIDGWTATSLIKANPLLKHIPIIALTAHAMAQDKEKAITAGCDDFDTKPIDMTRLLGKIEACLSKINPESTDKN
jgi:two-component system response regulator